MARALAALLIWGGVAVAALAFHYIYKQGWEDGYATIPPFSITEYYDAIGSDYDKCVTALGDAGIAIGTRCDGLEGVQ